MASNLFVACFALVLLYILRYLVKLYFDARSSPLNTAPDAHWSVRYTAAWIWWQAVQEQDAQAVHAAHVRLGPVVRVGPSEISVNDVDHGLTPIYDGRLLKTAFYQVANSYGQEPLVAMRDEEPHRRQKRLVAKPYSKTALTTDAEWQLDQGNLAKDLVRTLDKLAETKTDPEFYDIFFAWSLAVTSRYIFGETANLNLLHDLPRARRVREEYFSQRAYQFIGALLPVPMKLFDMMGYRAEIGWIRQMQDRADEKIGGTSVYHFMKNSLQATTEKKDSSTLPAKETAILSAEMQDHVIAGVDTSAVVLTVCAWLLSLDEHRHWQDRLREEIRSNSHESLDFETSPTLNAIIKETLRLYPVVAGGQPRVTSEAIVLGPPGNEVYVPAGTTVSCQAQSLHRSTVFDDADEFHPERWLDDTPLEKRREMDRWFWAFGSGSRRCLGENLGMSNLRMAVAAIWRNFETQATEKTTLTLTHGMIAMPLPQDGDFLRLRVRRV